MSKIRTKIIEVVDTDMVSRVFIDVISCRVLSNGSLVIKYFEDAAENTKIYKKASWRYYSRIWENNYLGGYLASHPLKDDFMNEPIFEVTELDESDKSDEDSPIEFKSAEICYNCKHCRITNPRCMYGICVLHSDKEVADEDSCSDFEEGIKI